MPRQSLPPAGSPGVYIHEVSGGSRPIEAKGTSTAGFVGKSPQNAAQSIAVTDVKAVAIDNWLQFQQAFFPPKQQSSDQAIWTNLAYAVYGFFLNGGRRCYVVDIGDGSEAQLKDGLATLAAVNEVAIVAAPGFTADADYEEIAKHCQQTANRVGILDTPEDKVSAADLGQYSPPKGRTDYGFTTMYTPWLLIADPHDPQAKVTVPPSGHVAGVWARNDAERGVHKAPANEIVRGALDLTVKIDDQTQTNMNRHNINAIRYFHDTGYVIWGARTLHNDAEWRYVNVRRLSNMIVESITESTRWIVFEPNDEFLWASIRRDVGAFLTDQWRQGALFGNTPEEAFFVKCDAENNPPDGIRLGRVTIDIGIAPILPAEFIIFRINQYESDTEVETT